MTLTSHRTAVPSATSSNRMPALMLTIATVGFCLDFWAWSLLSPLGPSYKDLLALSPLQLSELVAIPVLVGSLGRIPVGALTDRFGARVMFPAVTLATVPPVVVIGLWGTTYPLLLVAGFFLGIGGTSFAVGIPLVSGWFPPARRGLALGIFGVGTVGTAISSFTTVPLVKAQGRAFPFLLVAALLVAYAVVAAVLIRTSPDAPAPATGSVWRRTWATAKLPLTMQASFLYALGFGGFVAFSVYLPTYLKTAYGLSQGGAAARTAGFVVLAVIARPIGGWLSDRVGAARVLTVCLAGIAAGAVLASLELNLLPQGTVAFLSMAILLGAAAGAVFALVGQLAPRDKVGAVTGVVGAAGGLGGFIPPLVMGAIYGRMNDYSLGYVLLAIMAASGAVFTALVVSRRREVPQA